MYVANGIFEAFLTGQLQIQQLDLSLLPDVNSMVATAYTVYTSPPYSYIGQMRLGPDNRIYVIHSLWPPPTWNVSSSYVSTIDNPDVIGSGCNFNPLAFLIDTVSAGQSYVKVQFGLSNPVPTYTTSTQTFITDSLICFAPAITLSADSSWERYLWSNGSQDSAETFTQTGDYWLMQMSNGCTTLRVDSFHLDFVSFPGPGFNDSVLCTGDTIVLNVQSDSGVSYLWHDGSDSTAYIVDHGGVYRVTLYKEGCSLSDTISINEVAPFIRILENDTRICKDQPFTIHAVGSNELEEHIFWNTGATGNDITVSDSGLYIVNSANVCGVFADSIYIETEICNCTSPLIPNAFSPNGDGINDLYRILMVCPDLRGYMLSIYNRWGQRIFFSNQPNTGWDGTFNGKTADIGIYYYTLSYEVEGKQIHKKGDITLIR